jgi:hypothetical protein
MLITHLHSLPMSRMNGAVPLLPATVSSCRGEGKLLFYLRIEGIVT